jgi:hypothetical protein
MPSFYDMPPLGTGFNLNANGLLGQGEIGLNDRLGGTNTGLQRTVTQLSGVDVINALALSIAANPQAVMVLTGTSGTIVQPAGTIGVHPGTPTPGGSFNGLGGGVVSKPSLVKF